MNRTHYLIGLVTLAGISVAAIVLASGPAAPRVAATLARTAPASTFGLPAISEESRECIACHKTESQALYQQWGSSKHYRANVGCYECHAAEEDDPDVMRGHFDGPPISIIVSPRDCARCHEKEVDEFRSSHHSKGALILGSLDNVLAEVVEGNRAFVTEGFPEGNSSAAVSGCWQCHGSEVKVLPGGRLDPATWPNTGIGRINPDRSEGSCSACHSRHSFSVAQARFPDNCGKCHMGPDHPQIEIYEESKHGVAFRANIDRMNMGSPKWVVGEDYWAGPTCATCHMSATRNQDVTHDVGMRISWNNRPAISVRPEMADAKMNLPGADVPWTTRRQKMQDVCLNCHNQHWVDNFYTQYDGLVTLYNEKFAEPATELNELAKKVRQLPVNFTTEADWAYWELWHHEGRRARHGASMMGPDYTHWHGTYEVAKTFYTHYVPALRHLIEEGLADTGNPERVAAAEALEVKLHEVLNSDDHKWFLGKMDPAEAARRSRAAEDFKTRYNKD